MDHRVDGIARKKRIRGCGIRQIDFFEIKRSVRKRTQARKRRGFAVDKIIRDQYVVACGKQFQNGMASDVSGAAGHENSHRRKRSPFCFSFRLRGRAGAKKRARLSIQPKQPPKF